MADLSYQVTVDTQQAQQSLTKLQNSIGKTNQVFDSLKSAIAGLALGGFIQQAYAYADSIDDIAKSSNIAIDSVIGFGKALEYNGGRSDAAAQALATFTNNISDAVDGSASLQDAFGRLNVSLDDLATLSEQDLLNKVVKQLGAVDNASLRAALSTQIFGRAAKGVDIKGFSGDFAKYVSSSSGSAASIQAAAQASENFAKVISTFKIELLKALQPVSELAVKLLETSDSIKSFISVAFEIIKVVALFFLVTKAIQGIAAAAAILARAPALIAAGWATLTKTFEIFVWQLGKIRSAGAVTGATISGLAKRFAFLKQGLDLLSKGFATIAVLIYGAYAALKEFFGWGEQSKKDSDKAAEGDKNAASAARELQAAYAAKAKEIQAVSEAFKLQNSLFIDGLNTENAVIGKSKVFTETLKAQEAMFARAANESDKLRTAKEALTAQEKRAGLGAIYDQQIEKIQEIAEAEAKRIAVAVENSNKLQQIRELELFGIKSVQEADDKLLAIQRQIADIGLTEIEKGYREIIRAADDSAKAAIRAEEARRGEKITDAAEVKKYYDAARRGSEELIKAQKKLNDSSRTFSAGWSKAFADYKDNAENAATAAARVFEKFTSGLEDAIVDFAKTGKFEWKNFVEDMAEELLRSQIKSTLASLGSAIGLGDLFGGGMANSPGSSPNNPMYVIDISGGGAGGGVAGSLLGSAAQKSSSGGGGILSSIGSAFSGITDTISGLFSSGPEQLSGPTDSGGGFFSGISDFFSGFFANGGNIPSGRFGIVGEAGPEFVGGPASVTPMGGPSAVTYNINAVDARSFQQLLASDPSFIYALTEQGRKSFAGAR